MAAELAHTMIKGWEPRVWENLGWWWSVDKGLASIHPHFSGDGFTIFFNTKPQIVIQGPTAEVVLDKALMRAKQIARRITSDCRELMKEN